MTPDPRMITRPDNALLTCYVIVSLCTLIAFPFVFILHEFRDELRQLRAGAPD